MNMPPETLSLLFENAREYAIFMLDPQRHVILWNPGAEVLLGWTEAEILGQSCDLFFTPEDRENGVPQAEERRAIAKGRAEAERWNVRKDGSRFWGSAILFPVGQGDQRGYARVIRNRTHEYEAKLELRTANNLLNAILDQSPDPITLKDEEGRYLLCNRAAAHVIGQPADAILGHSDRELLPPEVGETVMQADCSVLSSGESHEVEVQVPAEGKNHVFLTTKTPIYDEGQHLIGLLCVSRDITARKEDEAALRDRETRLRVAAEGAELGIFTWNIATEEAAWDNSRMYVLFGRDPALGPYPTSEFFGHVIHPEDIPAFTGAVNGSRANGKPFQITCRVMRDDGQQAILRFTGRFEYDDDDIPTRYISVVADVTEAVTVETDLRRHQEEIEAVNFRLVRAMRETHHRVKNNLQVINALIEIQTLDKGATPEMQRVQQHISALAAIHDLLTRQITKGGADTHLSAREVLGKLTDKLQQMAEGRRISADIDDMLLNVHQAASLALLLNECISNALKHSKGAVEVSLHVVNDMAALSVCDDGPGFASDFDPRRSANTGLDLIETTVCHDLRGSVRFECHPGGGGRVIAFFPVTLPE